MSTDFYFNLSVQEIVYAAIVSMFLTILVSAIGSLRSLLKEMSKIDYADLEEMEQLAHILKKCYQLFPEDSLNYGNKVIKRGSTVRITTRTNKIIGRRFIGLNKENVICIVTHYDIITHQLDNVAKLIVFK